MPKTVSRHYFKCEEPAADNMGYQHLAVAISVHTAAKLGLKYLAQLHTHQYLARLAAITQ